MNKRRVRQSNTERCLLTEVAPYETPSLFSYWGAYNYLRHIEADGPPAALRELFNPQKNEESIPFKYYIKKGSDAARQLSVLHPKQSRQIVDFYKRFDVYITKLCRRSHFSLRAPHSIAKVYRIDEPASDELREIEEIASDRVYASSFFRYNRFSYLYRFFDSDEYAELEKNYSHCLHVDIEKCFDSIYTHSISWAIKGVVVAKTQKGPTKNADPFDKAFDGLMQAVNYKETHGIPIGPELSRIFAEVILQRIDLNVAQRMARDSLINGVDYCCYRYVDDIFLFFSEEKVQDVFRRILIEELLAYKLHLNTEKFIVTQRPFITKQSLYKQAVSDYVSDLFARLGRLRGSRSAKEIARLRASCPFDGVGFNAVSALFFSSLRKRLLSIDLGKYENGGDILYVLTDVALHAYRMAPSAASSYKLTELVMDVLQRLPSLPPFEKARIADKLIFELRAAVDSTMKRGHCVEAINILIALHEIKMGVAISVEFVRSVLGYAKRCHRDEVTGAQRHNYFSIVGLLYVLRDYPEYTADVDDLVSSAIDILERCNPYEYAESALLLLDLTSCPYLQNPVKNRIVKAGIKCRRPKATDQEVAAFRNFVSRFDWFFNWNKAHNLRDHLRKKKLTVTY